MRVDERGETLIELLVAVVIMGIALVAIVGGFVTATIVSDAHRKQSTAQAYARDYAEAVAGASYTACAAPSSYLSPSGFTVPTGYSKSIVSVRYWTGSVWSSSCTTDIGVQQVTVQVASADGRATERTTIVLRKPCGPGSSC